MSFISVLRLIVLSLSLLLSLVVVGITAHILSFSTQIFISAPDFEAVALLAGALTLIAFSVSLIVGACRRGAAINWVVVELPTLHVLWIIWLAAAIRIAAWYNALFSVGCGEEDLTSLGITLCDEMLALEGSSFVVWIILLIYSIILGTFARIGRSRGNEVWTKSVSEATFLDRKPAVQQTFDAEYGKPQQFPLTQYNNNIAQPGSAPVAIHMPPQMQYAVTPTPPPQMGHTVMYSNHPMV
ncbi:hypothetical protein C8J56DRAFT_1064627 [Mycena floridula]|nr:hypothetical protein C8J56DRAFT_1064627 [Mycena floridula]